jgi:type III restriction enzyme
MTNRTLRSITQRLSLRQPQADSLEILADVMERVDLVKGADPAVALMQIQELCKEHGWANVEDFEHEFPSLCFALATGVGKTRLMGAFIAYMYLTGKSRHFFVLAPNKTIYDKLLDDFSVNHPKYVFKGIAEFAQNPPLLITTDNFESGVGVRFDNGGSSDLFGADVHINIFNIDMINKEESPRGKPKMKSTRERIGESYYAYLSKLTDLVLVMDESHRYRASAGAKAIEGLKPILGLELTATPQTVGSKSQPFRNVILRYSLGEAMADGFVKEPAVATRANFNPKDVVNQKDLEKIKLEDAVHYHDHVAVELDRYHRVTGRPKKHPFILVVAQHTEHAAELKALIESDEFFKGRFKGKVIEVHSALTGEESDKATARLVALEEDDSTDIVIHVNKLKEGWDVTNLYTIVPLRASASDILTEQTLGRGLRLPYGARVSRSDDAEFAAVDTLTVIAHERFDELVKKAKEPGSIVMKQIVIGEGGDISAAGASLVESRSVAEEMILGTKVTLDGATTPPAVLTFSTPEEKRAAQVTLDVIRTYERKLSGLADLQRPEVKAQISKEVQELMRPIQGTLEGIVEALRVDEIVSTIAETVAERTISIPEIRITPTKHVSFTFRDFDLQDLKTINYQAIDDGLVVQTLRTEVRTYLAKNSTDPKEDRIEDYIVRYLIERNEIDYDAYAELLYKLAGQVVSRIRSYLNSAADIENVLLRNGRQIADFVFQQMMQNYDETPLTEEDYKVSMSRGFVLLQPQPLNVPPGQKVRDFRQAISPASDTRKYVFGGFKKCSCSLQRFDSDPERRFALLIDGEAAVEKWLKPGKSQFQIEYKSGEQYEPDFVVEGKDRMFICEIKAQNEQNDPIVVAKANAAVKWCKAASQLAAKKQGKPWSYVFITDDRMIGSSTFQGLVSTCTRA